MERQPLAPGPRSEHVLQVESAIDVDYPVGGPIQRWWQAGEKWIKAALGVSLAVTVTLAVVFSVLLSREQQQVEYTINFLVVGDWGREGGYNQSEVAALMGQRAATLSPDFVISTGDNFYHHGLNGTSDPLFDRSFKHVYTAPALQNVPWHAVLGNHDYGDGDYLENGLAAKRAESCLEDDFPCHVSPMHQLATNLIDRDPRWHCERQYSLQLAEGRVQIFFLDTTPFVNKYRKRSWAKYPGGVLQQSWEAQLRELETQLAASTAQWKIAVGHHPPRSSGHHGNTVELLEHVEPLLSKYGVQAYFAGHDHSLEHLHAEDAGYHVIVSGAGSECDRGFHYSLPESRYQWPWSGFVAATLTNHELRVEYHHLEQEGARPAYTAVIPQSP